MQLDPDLAARVDDLLRNDPRLIAAAALIGRVAVVVSEPKPERVRKSTAKRAPPRPGEQPSTAPAVEPEVEEAKPAHAPWLKVARAGKVSDALRAVLGDRVLVVVTVDGGLWGKLRVEDQQRALVLALRPVRHEKREDGSDKVAREAPPLQCHADTADDLSHLVAALGVDGAEGAAAVSAAEGLAERSEELDLLESVYEIKCPDTWHEMVSGAGLSPSAYLKYGEYARVSLSVLPDGQIIGQLLRQDGGDDEEVVKMTDAERRSEDGTMYVMYTVPAPEEDGE